jgi:hypothetical protein
MVNINDFPAAHPRLCAEIAFASHFKKQPTIVKDFTKFHGGNYGCYSGVIHIYIRERSSYENDIKYTDYKLYVIKLTHNAGYESFKDLFNDISDKFRGNDYKVINYTAKN